MIGEWGGVLQSANTDMIDGSIFQSIFWFSIPLLIGNFFQQLYNTVDSYVVGNFVNTNALAAVGASTPVIIRNFTPITDFNPRSHKGFDIYLSMYSSNRPISIHEATRASTRLLECSVTCKQFQSTKPQGLRQVYRIFFMMIQTFQSTKPQGLRPEVGVIAIQNIYFNPRSHKGFDLSDDCCSLTAL